MNIRHFKFYSKADILSLTRLRKFETKLGERISVLNNTSDVSEAISSLTAKYVVFGIPEDIGVQANIGIAGASSVWAHFLDSFFNIQSNDFLIGEEVAVIPAGEIAELKTFSIASRSNSTPVKLSPVNPIACITACLNVLLPLRKMSSKLIQSKNGLLTISIHTFCCK